MKIRQIKMEYISVFGINQYVDATSKLEWRKSTW